MSNQLAVVTGASTGIGRELARCAAENGYDLVIAADEPEINNVAIELKSATVQVEAVEADLSNGEGVERVRQAVAKMGRPVDALMANAGRGLGKSFFNQDTEAWRKVVDTNITGTLLLAQSIGRDMRARGRGRIQALTR